MIDIEDDHLGGAASLATALDDAGKGVEALHEADRAGGDAAAGEGFAAAAKGGEIGAGAGTPLEEHAFGAGEAHDGFHAVLHGVDEAGGALGLGLAADVEPDRRIESHFLLDEQVGKFVAESVARGVVGEIAALLRPNGRWCPRRGRSTGAPSLRARAVPGFPWKYLLATMLVAVCDQPLGTSTFSCLKIVVPFSLPINAVRFSHSTLSNGEIFPSVKKRSKKRPVETPPELTARQRFPPLYHSMQTSPLPFLFLPATRFPSSWRGTFYFTPLLDRGQRPTETENASWIRG